MNAILNNKVFFRSLGLIDYDAAWDYQTKLFESIIEIKLKNRQSEISQKETENYLLFCEHPPVFTLGKSGKKENLLLNENALSQNGVTFYETNRGGDITFHGPGQIVVYPILDLENFFTDIHKYMRFLEEVVICTLEEYGIKAGRLEGFTGVWIDENIPSKARKICAMGVKTSRWVTMHGLALNIRPDLSYFSMIVPCGISDKPVTSLENELGRSVDIAEVEEKLLYHFGRIFEMEIRK